VVRWLLLLDLRRLLCNFLVEGFGDGEEKLVDIDVVEGTALVEDGINFFGKCLSLLAADCPLCIEVALVAHHGHDDLTLGEVLDVVEPSG
jgi:hypothetical protein